MREAPLGQVILKTQKKRNILYSYTARKPTLAFTLTLTFAAPWYQNRNRKPHRYIE